MLKNWLQKLSQYGSSPSGGAGSNVVNLAMPGQGIMLENVEGIPQKTKKKRKWRLSKDRQLPQLRQQ